MSIADNYFNAVVYRDCWVDYLVYGCWPDLLSHAHVADAGSFFRSRRMPLPFIASGTLLFSSLYHHMVLVIAGLLQGLPCIIVVLGFFLSGVEISRP